MPIIIVLVIVIFIKIFFLVCKFVGNLPFPLTVENDWWGFPILPFLFGLIKMTVDWLKVELSENVFG